MEPIRVRRPGDERIECVKLRLPGGTLIRFHGPEPLLDACIFLDARRFTMKRNDSEVGFSIAFGDGLVYEGRANVRDKHSRDLAARLRNLESFRAALCPKASPAEAAAKFELFAASYAIGITPGRARRMARGLVGVPAPP